MDQIKRLATGIRRRGNTKLLHIVPSGSKWAVRADSSTRARRLCSTKRLALEFAKPLQKQGYTIAVHRENGMVEYIIDANGSKL